MSVAAHDALAAERRPEDAGIARHGELGEGLPRHPREGVEHVRLLVLRDDVVEEGAELGVEGGRRLVGERLHQPLAVQLRGQDAADPVHHRQLLVVLPLARQRPPQLLLGVPAVGDVDAGADVALEPAVPAEARDAVVEEPPVLAVVPAQAVLHRELPPRVEGRLVDLQETRAVVGVDDLRPAVADLLLHRPAGEAEPWLVEPVTPLVRARHPDHHRRAVGHDAEAILALARRAPHAPQRLLAPPSLQARGLGQAAGLAEPLAQQGDEHPDGGEQDGLHPARQAGELEREVRTQEEIVGRRRRKAGRQQPGTKPAVPGGEGDRGEEEQEGHPFAQDGLEGQADQHGQRHGEDGASHNEGAPDARGSNMYGSR